MEEKTIQNVSTIRILVLGDAGVGKSRLTDLLARSVDTPTPSTRSVGDEWWNVQVRLHEYPSNKGLPPTPECTSSSSPGSSRNSSERLACNELFPRGEWIACKMIPYFVEFYDSKGSLRRRSNMLRNRLYGNIDGIILIGVTYPSWRWAPKLDMLKTRRKYRSGGIADQLGADEILLNCMDTDSLAEKTRNGGKLRNFLNNAIDFKQYFPATC
ncbi:uncharacterized protein LOC6567199 [Drosophila grimshawi]|uniref:GH13768 n=1 Tax=Drosophila grimshawi TaxID=7222 RepID=B4JQW0_DROGR|nr:uncharacterized protein LOC6567199 [Drosophila grimshawi]EDV99290.1 GH13768 [Drosophila grimshawi]